MNTYYVTGKSTPGSFPATYNISPYMPADCGTGKYDPCKIQTNLTLGSTALQNLVNDPSKVTILDRHDIW